MEPMRHGRDDGLDLVAVRVDRDFPLFVPASPRWALVAGVASASTWPLGYFVGLALGNPRGRRSTCCSSTRLRATSQPAVAMITTIVIRAPAGARQLPAGREARPRRDGRGLARAAPDAGAPGGDQADPARAARRERRSRRRSLVARFEREAQATAALHSPHTIELYDFGVTRRRRVLLRDGAARRPRPRVAGAPLRTAAARARRSTC